MKKLKLFISLWFTMFSVAVFAQAEFEKIAITQNTLDNSAGRLIVQDATTGELKYILKSVLDNKFNQPTGNATQYLDGAGTPTAFPVLGQADRVITEVRNTTGATVVKGTVIYLSGASGGKATIQKAQANSELTSSGTFGVIQSDINNNSNGYAVVIGTVLGVNTSSYTEGQVLWLSPTVAGGFTSTKPVAPNHAVYVAIVTLAATNGTIEVKVQNGYEIDELHDVLITSKTNNDAIVYDSASGLWKNKQLVADAIADGTTTVAPSQNAVFDALAAKENTSSKNVANGYAGLGSDGKLFSTQLPSITITDTFVVGSQAAMLALTAETGDVAVRTDVNKSFILKGSDPAVLANWQELLTPTSAVTSVFGRNGAVTAQNGDYTTALVTETTNKRYQTDIQQAYNDATSSIQSQLNSKANDNTVVHLAGSESITGAKTFTATPSFDSNIYLKQLSSWANPAGYTVIGGRTDGFLVSASATKSALIGLGNLTQAWTYDFPNKSGTFAMTSDVPSISGTTNYVSKFTGASTLGNSQIFDNGTNIGIGIASPTEKLEVQNGTAGAKIKVSNTGGGSASLEVSSNASSVASLNFTNSLSLNGGNVGVNETAPNSKLTIKDDIKGIASKGSFAIENTSFFKSLYMGVSNFGQFNPFIQATSRNDMSPSPLLINPNGGNVGIGTGTTAPSGLLNVGSSASFHFTESGMGSMMLKATSGTARSLFEVHSADGSVKSMFQSVNGNGLILGTITNSDAIFYTNTTEKVRITSAGNVLVNLNSTAPYLDGKINSFGNSTIPAACFKSESNSQFTTSFWNSASGNVTLQQFVHGSGQSLVGSISSNGTTTSYNIMSDYRLKEDFKSINGLDLISKIKIYDFKFKNSDFRMGGVIAHELQKVVPYAVTGEKDGKDMQQVDYSKLVPILIQSIQELQKEIEILKNK